jgi:type VI protein secretion system component Hcp
MDDNSPTDVLMTFVQANDSPLPCEDTSEVDTSDPMMKGFTPARNGTPGSFFEVQQFTFGLNLKEDDQSGGAINQTSTQSGGGGAPTSSVAAAGPAGVFSKWYGVKDPQQRAKIHYPAQMDPFQFTRLMDSASPILFQNCCNSVSFKSASLVKRKVSGNSNALQAYLRFDFDDVLVISVDWDNGQAILESVEFIFCGMKVRHRRQKFDGSADITGSADWKQPLPLDNSSGSGGQS